MRVNTGITATTIRLIGPKGENHGIVPLSQALGMAKESGLDLIEIVPDEKPPVCKISNFGRFKYHVQKKAALAKKKQKSLQIKEIKLRPNISEHDYQVKFRAISRFLQEGHKVKVTLQFRGRELLHQELGLNLLNRLSEDLPSTAKIDRPATMEGRYANMILSPA